MLGFAARQALLFQLGPQLLQSQKLLRWAMAPVWGFAPTRKVVGASYGMAQLSSLRRHRATCLHVLGKMMAST